ncbi:kelch-like protein 41b [Topomyia yanbarensis]|uniref:kelch-like protein 41b n=1 Tax=Topomyia yanbarensis TaxID=2498891 RepID=UPI00273C66F9|nr:kelch-like protein 41b [Topomyia yanbarensis]
MPRTESLLNSKTMSDVTFTVGSSKHQIYAHKMILMNASDHFLDLFENSQITEISLEDVAPNIVLEILRFLYCEKINLTSDNSRKIFLQAKKWSLGKVMEAVANFLKQSIDSQNVLKMLMENRFYELKTVEEMCLQIICDNPFHYFEHNDYWLLDRESLKLIVTAKTINCSKDQLMEIVDKRAYNDNLDFADLRVAIESSNPLFACNQLRFFGTLKKEYTSRTDFCFTSSNPHFSGITLIGIGVLFKTREQNVKITVNGTFIRKTYAFRNPCVDTVNIVDIFFKHYDIKFDHSVSFFITFHPEVEDLCLDSPKTYHSHIGVEQNDPCSPIAHFYYKNIEQKS